MFLTRAKPTHTYKRRHKHTDVQVNFDRVLIKKTKNAAKSWALSKVTQEKENKTSESKINWDVMNRKKEWKKTNRKCCRF